MRQLPLSSTATSEEEEEEEEEDSTDESINYSNDSIYVASTNDASSSSTCGCASTPCYSLHSAFCSSSFNTSDENTNSIILLKGTHSSDTSTLQCRWYSITISSQTYNPNDAVWLAGGMNALTEGYVSEDCLNVTTTLLTLQNFAI